MGLNTARSILDKDTDALLKMVDLEEETIEEVGLKLFEFILDVASGRKKTFSDQWGLHNQLAVFNPAPVT